MNALQAMSEAFDGKALVPVGVLKRAVDMLREDAEEALLEGRPNTAKRRDCLADELATFLPKE